MKVEDVDPSQALIALAEAIEAERRKRKVVERPVPTYGVKTADGTVVYRAGLN